MWSYVAVETSKNSSSVMCGLRDLTHVSPVSPSVREELLCLPTRAALKGGVMSGDGTNLQETFLPVMKTLQTHSQYRALAHTG